MIDWSLVGRFLLDVGGLCFGMAAIVDFYIWFGP